MSASWAGFFLTEGLDDDEKGVITTDTLGGSQQVACVYESGLYALVFKSRKAAARKFRKWVTSEVLPALRQRREVRGVPEWLGTLNHLIGQGAPPELAKVAALVDMGVDPTAAAKLTLTQPRFSRSLPADRADVEEADDAALLAAMVPLREYSFPEPYEVVCTGGWFQETLRGGTDKKGKRTDAGNAKLGLRLQRVAIRQPSFRIVGNGRSRRFVRMPAAPPAE